MILFKWSNKHNRVMMGGFEYLHVDNVEADPGTGGAVFRTDDVGSGVQVPFAKLMDGRDGATGVIPGDATNGLFVNVTTSVLPTGAATASAQSTGNTALAAIQTAVEALDNTVAGSELQVDIVTSALPSGASTAAKQPALGTAGSASADVITVQGVGSMTPLLVNGSGVTQPVSDAGGSLTTDTPQLPGTLGQKAMAASLAVVLPSDQASIPVTVATIPSHAVTNAGTFATQVDGAALTALQLIDDVVFAEDSAAQAADKGIQILAVRRDANTSLVGADNDYAPLQVNADGSLKVAITAGAGSGGTSIADDAAFTPASTSITPVGGTYRSTLDAVDDGDAGAFAMTANRAIHVNLRTAAGVELAAGDQYTEDAASAGAENLTLAGAIRRDTAAVGSGADGDYSTINVNSVGRLWTTAVIDTALPAGTNNIGDVDVLSLPNVTLAAGTNTNEVVGDAAHDAAIAGNPVRVAGRGMSADYTAVASGDTADFLSSLLGKLISLPYALPANTWNYAAPAGGLVNQTAVTVKAAAGAGIRNYVTSVQIINSHQTISTEIMILDGAAGTVLWRGWAQAAGGGISCKFDPPLRGTADTLLEVDEVTATGTAGLLINLQGFVAAE